MLAEQVLDQGAEAAEHAIAFAGVLQRHNSLMPDVAGTQVELAAGLVAEVH